jgi:hypothetical protein
MIRSSARYYYTFHKQIPVHSLTTYITEDTESFYTPTIKIYPAAL